jgi:hypothetical protein
LTPLPGHANAPPAVVEQYSQKLFSAYQLPFQGRLNNHDNLQAVVSAITAAAVAGGPCTPRPCGLPPNVLPAAGDVRAHWVEGLIFNVEPLCPSTSRPEQVNEEQAEGVAEDTDNPLLPDDRDENADDIIARGRRLMEYLVQKANEGLPTGIGYAQFAAFVHGVDTFTQVAHRNYLASDTRFVISLASRITNTGGRKRVERNGITIDAGMDTFIWSSAGNHDRPDRAWQVDWSPPPYSQEAWLSIFPDGQRTLMEGNQLNALR